MFWHLCSVWSCDRQSFRKKNLHRRWRLDFHPLYNTALKKLNLVDFQSPSMLGLSALHHPKQSHAALDKSVYQKIICPSKRDIRYVHVNQAVKRIEGRVIDNDHYYRLFLMNMTAFENFMNGNGPPPFVSMTENQMAHDSCDPRGDNITPTHLDACN